MKGIPQESVTQPASAAELGTFLVYHHCEQVYLRSAPLPEYVVKNDGIHLLLMVLRETMHTELVCGPILNSWEVSCCDDNLITYAPIAKLDSLGAEVERSCPSLLAGIEHA